MKTALLPIAAIITVSAMSSVQADDSQNYVTDSYGEIVRDNYGSCVRSVNWTAETANASCEAKAQQPIAKPADADSTTGEPATPVLLPAYQGDIKGDQNAAYVIDSNGMIVRDNYGYCVRTINWSKEVALPKCEGWAEPKPAPVLVAKPTPVVVEEVVEVVIQEDAPAAFRGFFEFNKAILKEEAKPTLNDYAEYMKKHSEVQVKVTGHTDSVGSLSYNQTLSEARAKAVKTFLEEKGIDAQRIQAVGMGETQPVATNKTREGRAENRRVELEILK
ncbi:hypothetical protein THMIRHAM_03830 [Thiomicrorhabdus immobilis]|uniref:OmpA-like domain-containing protein n=1 Tax=Thiomicrorhabdus immobilis TaxID=2791037 RepID=A0ABM7MB76_9GAMM|nr:OmpA family protein [Thiomicrorhabdus immobilis]BCN92598.1 hypothetical protein THMIRHAM_03830 [Thiomicrorhabdus immobilis]